MFYVYVDYTLEEIPRPFYVGKGLDGRLKIVGRNKKHKWVRTQFGMRREIICSTLDEQIALKLETALVKENDTFNPDVKDYTDIRCNRTLGGELGTFGFRHTLESRRKMSEIKKRSFENPKMHEKLRLALNRPEVKQKRSEAQKLAQNRPETVLKRSNSLKGRIFSSETLEKMSDAANQRWENIEERQRQSEKIKISHQNSEVIEKISQKTQEAMQREDVKQRHRIAQQKRRERERNEKE